MNTSESPTYTPPQEESQADEPVEPTPLETAQGLIQSIKDVYGKERVPYDGTLSGEIFSSDKESRIRWNEREAKKQQLMDLLSANPDTARAMFQSFWKEHFKGKLASGHTVQNLRNADDGTGHPTDEMFDLVYTAFRNSPEGRGNEESAVQAAIDELESEMLAQTPAPEVKPESSTDNGEIIENYLSYSDADIPQEDKDQALASSMNNPQAVKYAESLKGLIKEHGEKQLREIAEDMQAQCASRLLKYGIIPGPYTMSKSWAMWDMGKQQYFFTHQDEADARYDLGDPLSDEKQEEIVDRHVGWEAYNAFMAKDGEFMDNLARIPNAEQVKAILTIPAKKNGTLSALDLARLGALLK
jgi:hypothetical protein